MSISSGNSQQDGDKQHGIIKRGEEKLSEVIHKWFSHDSNRGASDAIAFKGHKVEFTPHPVASDEENRSHERNVHLEQAKHKGQSSNTSATKLAAIIRPSSNSSSTSPAPRAFRFNLIPRPVKLEQIGPARIIQEGKRIAMRIVWNEGPYLHNSSQIKAMLHAFEEILGVRSEHTPNRTNVPEHVLAITLHDNVSEARYWCKKQVGLDVLPFQVAHSIPAHVAHEWHIVIAKSSRIAICAQDPQGAYRFAATLRQLSDRIDVEALPEYALEDWPEYPWRGLHLDSVRHFMPLEFLKRYLRAMSYYKANVFHWHLTDDQAWRLYLPSRPGLVNASAKTSPGFYGLQDVRALVDFATSHFITIIPGIETPGHSLSALAVYPELACIGDHFDVPTTREKTYDDILCVMSDNVTQFATDVFGDVAALFPGRYVHVGGDEIPTTKWESSSHIQSFVQSHALNNSIGDVLEAWLCFVTQILRRHGRAPIVWDDHFAKRNGGVSKRCDGAEEDWLVQAWHLAPPVGDETKTSINPKFPFRTIASPASHVYLDQPLSSIDWNKSITFLPGVSNDRLLGGSANMWTEDTAWDEVPSKVYPRYLAIANQLWSANSHPEKKRLLDVGLREAAEAHCHARDGALRRFYGFLCGQFDAKSGGKISDIWVGATVKHSFRLYLPKQYHVRTIFNDNDESFLWVISPKKNQYLQAMWREPQRAKHRIPVGKWLASLAIQSGCRDRPGDRLEHGVLNVLQWLPAPPATDPAHAIDNWENTTTSGPTVVGLDGKAWNLTWSHAALFDPDGRAVADPKVLAQGPVAGFRIIVLKAQTKWMTISKVSAEEGPAGDHPTEEELNVPILQPSNFVQTNHSSF